MAIKVGKYDKKEVSELNNELYKKAEEILQDETGSGWHIGWIGVGCFVDWIENNYEITKKNK